MYFRPKVVYPDPKETRENSILRYIGYRVLRNNRNFLCSITGATGSGKSYLGLALCETYAKMHGLDFDPKVQVISSLKELLQLITGDALGGKLKVGSPILFDEPQTEANSRSWQSEVNQAFNSLMSTFRNQRLVVFFALPYMEMIDKQSRILFHGEFRVEGFDKTTKITTVKPRFLEYNKNKGDFYIKRLIIEYAVEGKKKRGRTMLGVWKVPLASKEVVDVYEEKKKKFTDDLNRKLLAQLELKDQALQSKNKNEEFKKLVELYKQYGEDYVKLTEFMPYLNVNTLRMYLYLIKKSFKHVKPQRGAATWKAPTSNKPMEGFLNSNQPILAQN